MIVGQRAFPQKTLSELVQKKSKGIFRSIDSYDVSLPETVKKMMEKCMAIEVEGRYSSSAQFGQSIFGILREISTLSPHDTIVSYLNDPLSIQPYTHSPHRRPLLLTVILSAVASILAAAGIVLYMLLR
jgi:hypothetical protein